MSSHVSEHVYSALDQLLRQVNVVSLGAEEEVRVVWAPLPGRAAAAVSRVDDALWLILDDTKPHSRGHGSHLLTDLREQAGGADILRLRRGPESDGPCALQLVS